MTCSWEKEDYFSLLMSADKRAHTALEMLVDDLHTEKEKTIAKFLCHSGSEDFLWGLVRLLGNDNTRVAGNAAYILGTLAESDLGCSRVLALAKSSSTEGRRILPDLTRMLTFDDSESVMNAAGTMGTLAESHEGREWILSENCLPQTLEHVTALLHSENLWTASNAALVLARLSISEEGCSQILRHEHSQHILSKLVLSLGVDEAGRGMNAAFAIGRLCDMDNGRKRLLVLSDSERMISALAKMLSCDDTGASKNACFALSCLATNTEGHTRLLSNIHSEDILRTLSGLLTAEDSETGWFAAMTLRTLASQPKGCLRLRDHPQVVPGLKLVEAQDDANPDLKEEAIITLEILKRLEKPNMPSIDVLGAASAKASWEPVTTKSGFQVRYQLFDGSKCVYTGKETTFEVTGLQANTTYTYKVRAYTEGDESPFSDPVSITTEESVPGPPQNLRVLGSTITQLKVGWDPPEEINGVMKGYYVYYGDKQEHHTLENTMILTSLTAHTSYEIQVCASTVRGRGERASVVGMTAEIGAHAPSKPVVTVIGRNELHVAWNAPEVPLGRFNRYDVTMNEKIIYSGTELNFTVRRLTPDTEYSFAVIALTSEGKFDSKVTRRRTAKDEYDSNRPPLYQNPRKGSVDDGQKTPVQSTSQKKRKSIDAKRIASAKRVGTAKERIRSSTTMRDSPEPRPVSAVSSVPSSEAADKPPPTPKPEKHPPTPQNSQTPTSVSTRPNSAAGKPVAEVTREAPRPVSRNRTFHSTKESVHKTQQKPERTGQSGSSKVIPVSYVSIQGSSTGDSESGEVTAKLSADKEGETSSRKPVSKVGAMLDPTGVGNALRMERSKTMMPRDPRKQRSRTDRTEVNGSERSESFPKSVDRRQFLSDKGSKGLGRSMDPIDFSVGAGDVGKQSMSGLTAPERHKGSNSHERSRGHVRNGMKSLPKDAVLPKPSPPSQQYLEGLPGMGAGTLHNPPVDTEWAHRSVPSPRSLKDIGFQMDSHEADWLSQVKRVSDLYTKSVHPANMYSLTNPNDSTYCIDSPQFIQRTNTYINSHRPTGRKSLEKLSRSSHAGKGGTVLPVTSSLTFDPEIPESKSSTLGNKFVPMQLRTQPSNLGMNQLQRMNTTLLGDISGDSVQFRRVEAITRSQTQLDLRQQNPQHQGSMATSSNYDDGVARRDLGLIMSSPKHRDRALPVRSKSLSNSGSAQKLTRASAGGAGQHHKEPDSMFLQQSWGMSKSQDVW